MKKYDPENERVKRDYAFFLEAANGKQNASIDAALRAIERFEISNGRKPFRKFHIEQSRSFRARLIEETGKNGKPLSAATITATLKHLRNFFLWLSREPGFRSALNANASYFSPSDQDLRVAQRGGKSAWQLCRCSPPCRLRTLSRNATGRSSPSRSYLAPATAP